MTKKFLRRKLSFLILAVILMSCAKAQENGDGATFRIVGYYSLTSAMEANFETVPFDELTHINLYFLNPDSLGNFNTDLSAIIPFVKEAHRHNVKVLPSIGGGSPHPYYHSLLMDNKRAKLVNDLLQIALKYDFDGIDVDIEGGDISSKYEDFVVDLKKELHQHGKLLTAAIAVYSQAAFTDKALEQFNFVNLMSYDHTGPWRPDNPGPHSTYDQAVEDLNFFATTRSIQKEKITLGVPFYGYSFGPTLQSPPGSLNYNDIVSQFPGAESTDSLLMPSGATLHYNGIPTIKKKTLLAKEKGMGIMIWQISGDAGPGKSLLDAIYHEIHGG
ncbi:MAG: glycosyl hydrolase family 18 protein [Ginsengibacter sp.]